jgi:RecA/RadA recombinase
MKDSDTNIMDDGKNSAEFTGYVDTGCLIFNSVISGSLSGGFADNKVLAIAGESSTGKTFLALGIVKEFLDRNPEAGVAYFDTESAVTKDMMRARGIDVKRVILSEPESLQDFRTKAIRLLEKYAAAPKKSRPPMLVVLDSLGMLSSAKELEDTAAGKDTRDMTKAQLIRGLFRVLRLRMAKLKVPMIITSHTYAVVGAYVPMQELSGGGGLKYAADNIVFLSKKKDKDKDGDIGGVLLKARMYKSRLSRENQDVEMRLSYSKGLDRFYCLLQLALEEGLFKKTKVGSSNAIAFPDGEVVLEWKVEKEPEKYIPEWLPQIEKLVNAKFRYGEDEDVPADEIAELEGEEGMLQSIFGEQTEG